MKSSIDAQRNTFCEKGQPSRQSSQSNGIHSSEENGLHSIQRWPVSSRERTKPDKQVEVVGTSREWVMRI